MLKPGMFVTVLLTCLTCSYGQTAADVEKKYGPSLRVYSVTEHIWMSADYGSDGQLCRMRLYPRHVNGKTSYVGARLRYEEVRNFLNSLVPPDQRGTKSKVNFGTTATGGPAAWTTYPYEAVTFTFISSMGKTPYDESQLLRRGEFKFSISATEPLTIRDTETPSADDFLPSQTSTTEIVTVEWNGRKCGE